MLIKIKTKPIIFNYVHTYVININKLQKYHKNLLNKRHYKVCLNSKLAGEKKKMRNEFK